MATAYTKEAKPTTSFAKESKPVTSFTKEGKPTTAFTKEVKPGGSASSFLLKQDGFYLLQESGYKIVLAYGSASATTYTKESKPTTSYTKEPKP